MLISHKYRFIFIKTVKTAGTSIEVDLSRVMDDDDVVTPIKPPVAGHVARNHAHGGSRLYNHMSARELRAAIGRETFDGYFKFCVEREPVDKCISHYSMLKKSDFRRIEGLTWEAYLRRGLFPRDHAKYTTLWGRLMVDRILRYETLDADLAVLASELGFPFAGLQTTAKAGLRDRVDVSAADRRRIYRAFWRSLRHTGYRLEAA